MCSRILVRPALMDPFQIWRYSVVSNREDLCYESKNFLPLHRIISEEKKSAEVLEQRESDQCKLFFFSKTQCFIKNMMELCWNIEYSVKFEGDSIIS